MVSPTCASSLAACTTVPTRSAPLGWAARWAASSCRPASAAGGGGGFRRRWRRPRSRPRPRARPARPRRARGAFARPAASAPSPGSGGALALRGGGPRRLGGLGLRRGQALALGASARCGRERGRLGEDVAVAVGAVGTLCGHRPQWAQPGSPAEPQRSPADRGAIVKVDGACRSLTLRRPAGEPLKQTPPSCVIGTVGVRRMAPVPQGRPCDEEVPGNTDSDG